MRIFAPSKIWPPLLQTEHEGQTEVCAYICNTVRFMPNYDRVIVFSMRRYIRNQIYVLICNVMLELLSFLQFFAFFIIFSFKNLRPWHYLTNWNQILSEGALGYTCIRLMWVFLIPSEIWPPLQKVEHRGQTSFGIHLQPR